MQEKLAKVVLKCPLTESEFSKAFLKPIFSRKGIRFGGTNIEVKMRQMTFSIFTFSYLCIIERVLFLDQIFEM